MATLFRRKSWWYLQWWEGGRQRRQACHTQDHRVAEEQLSDLRRRLRFGESDPTDYPTDLSHFAREFLRAQEEKRSADHVRNQRRQVESFLEAVPLELAKVRMHHVERWLRKLGRRLSPRSVNQARGTIRLLFRQAQKRGLVRDNPADLVDRLPEDRIESGVLSRAEFDRAIELAHGTPYLVPLALGALAGLRRGEICALRWEDVDLDRGELLVRRGKGPRGRQDRYVPIGRRLAGILSEADRHSVFAAAHRINRKRWGSWTPSGLTHGIRDFGRSIRLPQLNGPQILRRSFGSWLVAAGQSLVEVSRMMGHSSVVVTERHYIRFAPGHRGMIDEL